MIVLISVLLSKFVRDELINVCPRAESKALASIRISASAESMKFVPNVGIRFNALAESKALASIRVKAAAESIKSIPILGKRLIV